MTDKSLKSLAILSYKGGVGKTSIAVNIAVHLAKKGKKVCLLENDFNGPSLNTWWEPEAAWLNDYLLENADLDECLQDVSPVLEVPGKLYVGFADPTAEAIQKSLRTDKPTHMKMLQNLLRTRRVLDKEPYTVDYVINDCSPGLGFTAINAMLASDSCLFIVKLSNADIMGTSRMIKGLYQQLKKRTMVLANLIPNEIVNDENKKSEAQNLIEKNFAKHLGQSGHMVNFLGWIPTDEKLATIEFEQALKNLRGEELSRIIYTLNQPEHVFSTTIADLAPVMFEES